jgi:hypothetical protein
MSTLRDVLIFLLVCASGLVIANAYLFWKLHKIHKELLGMLESWKSKN